MPNNEQTTITFHDLSKSVEVVSREVNSQKNTLFAICFNETHLLEAFFAYYRSQRVEQFIILDDHSTDGSFEFLLDQPDCVVLKSKYRYGDVITLTDRLKWTRNNGQVA